MKIIDLFRGTYFYLSNFYNCPIGLDGFKYQNAEAAFQAQKTKSPTEKAIFASLSAAEAKKMGRKIILRPDWEAIKDNIMFKVCRAKFQQNPLLAAQLIATGDALLIEGNTHGDVYWGVCKGQGQNKLGIILMHIRDHLKPMKNESGQK